MSNFYSVRTLIFIRYIETAKEVLSNKHSKHTLCVTINMISELLLYNLFQTFVTNNINLINNIHELWQLSLTTLSKIYETDGNESIFTLSNLCDHILR